MSTRLDAAAGQLLKKCAAGLGADCALCGGAAEELVCAACERALPRLDACCTRCALPLPQPGTCGACLRAPPAFDDAHAAFEYRFPVDRMVHRFKFRGDLALGRWLAQQLGARVRAAPRPQWLVAPPLGPGGLRRRGFNQSVEIARRLARDLGVPLDAFAVRRLRETPPQRALDAKARHANLAGAFACARALAGAHVAVVDDVVTTGATGEAMARAVRQAGAARVSLWSVARTP